MLIGVGECLGAQAQALERRCGANARAEMFMLMQPRKRRSASSSGPSSAEPGADPSRVTCRTRQGGSTDRLMPVEYSTPTRSGSTSGTPASAHASRAEISAQLRLGGSSRLISWRSSTSAAGNLGLRGKLNGQVVLGDPLLLRTGWCRTHPREAPSRIAERCRRGGRRTDAGDNNLLGHNECSLSVDNADVSKGACRVSMPHGQY